MSNLPQAAPDSECCSKRNPVLALHAYCTTQFLPCSGRTAANSFTCSQLKHYWSGVRAVPLPSINSQLAMFPITLLSTPCSVASPQLYARPHVRETSATNTLTSSRLHIFTSSSEKHALPTFRKTMCMASRMRRTRDAGYTERFASRHCLILGAMRLLQACNPSHSSRV